MMFLCAYVFLAAISQAVCQFDPIAFTLGQDAHVDHLALANDTTVPYNVVITSHGSPTLNAGAFVCTKDGLYKFQVFSLTKSGSNLFLELYHNQQLVASLWGHTTGDYASAGNAVILPLTTGDTVEVKVRGDYEVHIYGGAGEIYTTFTGVQLGSLETGTEGSQLSAFSATLNQHEVVTSSSPVLYNNVLTDTNQAYNQSAGVYTAPTGGLYVFHFYSLSKNNAEEWQELFRNSQYICSIYGKSDQEWADAGNTVLLHLNTGDEVTVRSHKGRTSTLYGGPDEIYSSFSGAQIATDNDLSSGFFGFSAGLSSDYAVNAGQNVVYDSVFFDDVNAYNKNDGTFTAPVAGLYEFNYHALGKQHNEIWLELFKNDAYINSLYGHIPGNWATAGNAAVLQLAAGDRVSVRGHNAQLLYGTTEEIYCTFTGYLLAASNAGVIVGK